MSKSELIVSIIKQTPYFNTDKYFNLYTNLKRLTKDTLLVVNESLVKI